MFVDEQRPAVDFDADAHVYRVAGRAVMSVTQILQAAGECDDFRFVNAQDLERARQRGVEIDESIQYEEAGTLANESELSPVVLAGLQAFRTFKQVTGWRTLAIQPPLFSPRLDCAGTPDLVGVLNSHGGVIDVKATAAIPRSVNLQVGAYTLLCRERWPDRIFTKGWCLWLKPGRPTPKLIPIDVTVWAPQFERVLAEFRRRVTDGK